MRCFKAKVSTDDRRLKKGNYYYGRYVKNLDGSKRICIYDEQREVMTFAPHVFKDLGSIREWA